MKNWRTITLETVLKNSKYIRPTDKSLIGIRKGMKITARNPIIDIWGYDADQGIVKITTIIKPRKRLEMYTNSDTLVVILEGKHSPETKHYDIEAEVLPGIMLAIERKNGIDIYCTDTLGVTVIDGGELKKQLPEVTYTDYIMYV
ncbi:hypothetical protein DRN75_04040 [Nanoarchaeota archaeon]|nr:MAG: hypothetical protein DRN75_04040 [Nanoarchaeota archaeon]